MALPAELLDHILSFLKSDPEILETCSESHPLLCHTFGSDIFQYKRLWP